MDGRTRSVNRVVQGYDKDLVAQRERNGAIHIYRKTGRSSDPLVFITALTDTWTASGKPVEWGLEVVRNRLIAHDLWKDETVVDRLEKEQMAAQESAERDRMNSIEAFLYEFRRSFARATNDINTSALAKVDRRALKGA